MSQEIRPTAEFTLVQSVYEATVQREVAAGSIIDALRAYAEAECLAPKEAAQWDNLRDTLREKLKTVPTLSEGSARTRSVQMVSWLKHYAADTKHTDPNKAVRIGFREHQKAFADYQKALTEFGKTSKAAAEAARKKLADQKASILAIDKGTKLATYVASVVAEKMADADIFAWAAANVRVSLDALVRAQREQQAAQAEPQEVPAKPQEKAA